MIDELSEELRKIPQLERTILLPQCLRSNQCKAVKKKHGLIECQECYQEREDGTKCPIPTMVKMAHEAGYKKIYIFTGGSGIALF